MSILQEELEKRIQLSGRSMNDISLAVVKRRGKTTQLSTSSLIRDIVSGKSKNPSFAVLLPIAEELDCTVEDLYGISTEKNQSPPHITKTTARGTTVNIIDNTSKEIIADCKALATHFVKKGVLDKEVKSVFFNELLGERLLRDKKVQEGEAISNNLSISEIETLLEQVNHIGLQL